MMNFLRLALPFTFLTTLPVNAEEPLTASEFDAYTQGKTLTYADQGQSYGAEEYYPNNEVKWAFEDGECLDGVWFQQDKNICFLYENESGPQCWTFYLEQDKLRAIFAGDSGTELYEAWTSPAPTQCMGPQIGV